MVIRAPKRLPSVQSVIGAAQLEQFMAVAYPIKPRLPFGMQTREARASYRAETSLGVLRLNESFCIAGRALFYSVGESNTIIPVERMGL